ncbi:hypothetical protein D915_002147 [Fasciola hepatica]|uniref:Uncharacterized protein n=1 Tax=Fasciola hepatica TaxID=6192 RepID=A0A4E0RGY0_FASHE|nr:hypothetical protein D915_002147 [Fasciola hepatica]
MAVSPIGLATRVSGQVTDQAKTQLNPHVVHQQLANTLQQRRASAETRPTTEKPRIVSVHSMRLDPNTLETLIQFNIAEAHQIPGYQPVPPGLPDWKTQKLERKNRDAADAYAADLRKWGCIPQWKRELIEKRHHGKTDSTPARTSSVTNDSHPDLTQSLISVELTEKLQRRLEKVAAMAES